MVTSTMETLGATRWVEPEGGTLNIRSWDTPTLLRRAGAKMKGISGINGEFGYPGEIVAPSGIAHPTGSTDEHAHGNHQMKLP